jgi:hypothetical protein
MALQKFIPKGNIESSNQLFISISNSHIRFTSEFARKANLTSSHKVCIYLDPELLQIHFEFHKDDVEGALKLTLPKEKKQTYQCTAVSLLSSHPWIKAIAFQNNAKNRRFEPKRVGKRWMIELSPSFDKTCTRSKSSAISTASKGIYRYIDSTTEEIVYIGKGEIAKRLKQSLRDGWVFDKIEYSTILNEDEQFKWESYWLNKFEEENKRLPRYNMIRGKKPSK